MKAFITYLDSKVEEGKAKTAELLAACLKRHTGRFTPVYTRTQDGRQILRKCRKRSYLSPLEQPTEKKYRVAGSP